MHREREQKNIRYRIKYSRILSNISMAKNRGVQRKIQAKSIPGRRKGRMNCHNGIYFGTVRQSI